MVLSPAATTHRVQGLHERGLVHRRPNADDGRLGVVELTDAGLRLVEEAVTDHVATLDAMLGGVSSDQRKALTAALAAVEPNAAPD